MKYSLEISTLFGGRWKGSDIDQVHRLIYMSRNVPRILTSIIDDKTYYAGVLNILIDLNTFASFATISFHSDGALAPIGSRRVRTCGIHVA